MWLLHTLFIIFFLYFVDFGKAIVINAVIYAYDSNNGYFTSLVNAYNEYTKKNNIDLTINLNSILEGEYDDFSSFMGANFAKKSKKYDIFFNSARLSSIYASHFEDLKKYLSSDYSKLIHPEIYKACEQEGRLIGLPTTTLITGLYSNINLLNKYNKRVPKTWKELMETSKYILAEERKLNNTNLIPYNGIFCDEEDGTSSLYEFIYSFRDNINSPFPDLKSKNTIDALKMIKQLKEELNLEDVFKQSKKLVYTKLDGSILFFKFWYFNVLSPLYSVDIMPGHTEGVSGGVIGSNNMGINKYSDEEKKIAAAKAIEYMTSETFQRKYVIDDALFSVNLNAYDEKSICEQINCPFLKSFQPIPRPYNRIKDYEDYSEKFRKYAYEYIYGNKTVEEASLNLYNLEHIYYLSLDTEDTSAGLVFLIIYSISSIVILASSSFLYTKKHQPHFSFFTKDLWYMIIVGFIIQLASRVLEFGPVNNYKWHIKIFLYSFGYMLIIIPTLYKLICNFPEENKISNWVQSHKYLFIGSFLMLDVLLCSLFMIIPYEITIINGSDRKKFEVCDMKNSIGQVIMILIVAFKGIIILGIGYLVFCEWNLKETILDIHYITSALYINCIGIIGIAVLKYINYNDYVAYHTIHQTVFFVFIFVNYIFYYGFRIFLPLFRSDEANYGFTGPLHMFQIKSNNKIISVNSNQTKKSNLSNASSGKYSKLISYHFQTSIGKKDSINSNSSTILNNQNSIIKSNQIKTFTSSTNTN
ncbi:periplasmic binding protein-like II [Piromyces finnis]|uniref:Periplasmic binding protein-like II n=1 Tax=Piromyces finnis TaxID=1754191 RepID=A0A1Y1VKK8_9FUNG|nr:periplasmic binding protein-like II [Piromyces finnis]|eukprot:ORX57918.1 periplasmic binding protein-like II [Piromyces finnis]